MNTGGQDLGTHLGVISKLFIVAMMADRYALMTCLLPWSEEGARSRMNIAELVVRREGQLAKQAGSAQPVFMPLSMKTLVHVLGPRGEVFLRRSRGILPRCGR